MSAAKVTPIRPTVENRYLSPAQVCDLVPGMTVENLKELRKTGRGPAYFKPTGETYGKVVVYAEADVRLWVEAGRIVPGRAS